MVSVLVAVAALGIIGLLFAVDPGGGHRRKRLSRLSGDGLAAADGMGLPDDRRSRSATAYCRAVAVAQVPAPAGARGASAPTVLGDPAARFNARRGGICAGRPRDMVPGDTGLHHRDVPSAARCESRPWEQGSASYTGCPGGVPQSMTGSGRYATACRRVSQRLMRCMKRSASAETPSVTSWESTCSSVACSMTTRYE